MNPDGSETLPTPPEPNKFWWCRGCNSSKIHTYTLGEKSMRLKTEGGSLPKSKYLGFYNR